MTDSHRKQYEVIRELVGELQRDPDFDGVILCITGEETEDAKAVHFKGKVSAFGKPSQLANALDAFFDGHPALYAFVQMRRFSVWKLISQAGLMLVVLLMLHAGLGLLLRFFEVI